MTESQNKLYFERYRLPVKFDGEFTIHPVSDLTPGKPASDVEERWSQKQHIAKGGFGDVWLQEEAGGELRAVKQLVQAAGGVDFTRELVTLATLADHRQSFVQLYGWYEDVAQDFFFLAMEYIAGGDLSRYLGDPIIRSEAKEITKQLLQGIAIMHERLICHRDIKPQNVLVVSLKPIWVKLADFGVSKVEKDTFLRTRTGTLAYSAPELYGLLPKRLKPREVYSNAVDMWSLGCVVHEILTTERPFLLEPGLEDDFGSSMQLDTMSAEPQSDIDMIIEFCRNQRDFPEKALKQSGVSASETSFVKALLVPDPRRRLSAVNALANPWITGETPADNADALIAMPDPSKRLARFISRNSLEMFYTEINQDLANRAQFLATNLIKRGCPRGIATSLEVLVLYDLALLISDSDSMLYEQDGERIVILQRLLNAITSIYNLARERGVMTTQFLNTSKDKKNVTTETVKSVITGHAFGGVARVGTQLKRKIIDQFVAGPEMTKPLLVIVIGDQASEGESTNLLEDVLKNCVRETTKEDGVSKGAHSTAFQFVRIGDDNDGVETLQRLARDFELKGHVNFRRVHGFDHEQDSEAYWIEITQILLGAFAGSWE